MAPGKKPAAEVPFRAAQGVSRFFLFEALRTGCEVFENQHGEMQSARDKAEGLLVKEQPVEFESLLQEILRSCAKSLQTHASIVEAIAETLSADADETAEGGLKASGKYALIVGKIKDAAAGVEQLRDVNVKKEKSPTPPAESDFDSSPEVQSTKKANAREPEEPTPRKKTKTKHAPNTSASMKETLTSDSEDEKPMKGKGKKLSPPLTLKKKKPKSPFMTPLPAGLKDSTPSTDMPPATPVQAAVSRRTSFEDISSEVTARLAAKELKHPKATPEHIAAPLPAKKKARVETTKSDSKGKRQDVDDVSGGKGKAKVKKQKIDVAGEEEVKVESEAKDFEEPVVEAGKVKANKPKRRRSSNVAETSAPTATLDAAPETNIRKKRRVGF